MVLALPLPEGNEVVGEGGVRVHPLDLHVPLVQTVVYQLNLVNKHVKKSEVYNVMFQCLFLPLSPFSFLFFLIGSSIKMRKNLGWGAG